MSFLARHLAASTAHASSQCQEWEHLSLYALDNWSAQVCCFMGKKFWLWSTACRKQVLVFWKWLALRTVRPTGKEALTSTVHADSNYPVRGRQAILSTVRKKAVQQVFLFFCFFSLIYVQHQLHPTALFVCTTMRIIYIVLCIAAKRRYHNTFQDIHKQRDYSIFFLCLFYHLFAKVPACHEIVLLL